MDWKNSFPKENRYFETERGILYCGDTIALLNELSFPKEEFDMILTDPPYGISHDMTIKRSGNTRFKASTDLTANFGEWDRFNTIQEFMAFTYKWVDLVDILLRPGGMFISYFDRDKINFLSFYLQSKEYKMKGYYADCKSNPPPQLRKVKWMNGWEEAGLWQKKGGKLTYVYQLGQHKDYGIRPIVGGKERTKHPTQKPLKVIRDFILWWSNEDDLIIDPFAGSGTTLVASELFNRRWIGVEINEEYCEITKERLIQIGIQKGLF